MSMWKLIVACLSRRKLQTRTAINSSSFTPRIINKLAQLFLSSPPINKNRFKRNKPPKTIHQSTFHSNEYFSMKKMQKCKSQLKTQRQTMKSSECFLKLEHSNGKTWSTLMHCSDAKAIAFLHFTSSWFCSLLFILLPCSSNRGSRQWKIVLGLQMRLRMRVRFCLCVCKDSVELYRST